jgi:hypothetical protein
MGWHLAILCCVAVFGLFVPGEGAWAQGPWRASRDNTPGWQLMTPAERVEHQARIRSFSNYDECAAYRHEHRRLILERAQAAGKIPGMGRRDFCAHLPRRGGS